MSQDQLDQSSFELDYLNNDSDGPAMSNAPRPSPVECTHTHHNPRQPQRSQYHELQDRDQDIPSRKISLVSVLYIYIYYICPELAFTDYPFRSGKGAWPL